MTGLDALDTIAVFVGYVSLIVTLGLFAVAACIELRDRLDDADRRRHIRDAALREDREVELLEAIPFLPEGWRHG